MGLRGRGGVFHRGTGAVRRVKGLAAPSVEPGVSLKPSLPAVGRTSVGSDDVCEDL